MQLRPLDRGGTPTRLALALAEALRGPLHAHQAPLSPPVDRGEVRPGAQAETEKQVAHSDEATRDLVLASGWEASEQRGASVLQCDAAPHEAHEATGVGAAAVAPVPHPLAPTETLLQASARWRWNSEAAPFTPVSLAAVEMVVDVHSAPVATTSTAAEPAAAAAGGALGVRGKEATEVYAAQAAVVASVMDVDHEATENTGAKKRSKTADMWAAYAAEPSGMKKSKMVIQAAAGHVDLDDPLAFEHMGFLDARSAGRVACSSFQGRAAVIALMWNQKADGLA
jgi:hypothetical protein